MAALLNSGMERAARAQEAAFTSVGKEQKKRGKEETAELKREERKELQMYRYRLFKLIFNSSLHSFFSFPTL